MNDSRDSSHGLIGGTYVLFDDEPQVRKRRWGARVETTPQDALNQRRIMPEPLKETHHGGLGAAWVLVLRAFRLPRRVSAQAFSEGHLRHALQAHDKRTAAEAMNVVAEHFGELFWHHELKRGVALRVQREGMPHMRERGFETNRGAGLGRASDI